MIKTAVCVVGAGPAGAILSYLLARNGIDVTLIEAQKDFDRDFRGDTLHYSVMENLAEMGLADRLMAAKPHYKMRQMSVEINDKSYPIVDFGHIKTEFPYVTVMAQPDFLQFITDEAQQYPHFRLMMRTIATDISRQDGKICGVTVRQGQETMEIKADLVVACDGRSSKLRQLAGLTAVPLTKPLDVLWFRLPRHDADEQMQIGGGVLSGNRPIVIIERVDHHQIGVIVPHGHYRQIKSEGLDAFRQSIVDQIPQFADRVHLLDEWRKIAYLQVTGSRLEKWYTDGLLLIGDAAHVMTPIGGVGINYAIQDAIVAANVLVEPLKNGSVNNSHFAAIQKQRQRPTALMQTVQVQAQKRIIDPARAEDVPFQFPKFARWLPSIPLVRNIIPKLIGSGLSHVKVKVV